MGIVYYPFLNNQGVVDFSSKKVATVSLKALTDDLDIHVFVSEN